ncbi:MAG: late competence development ComFB family protein [Candidatus Omnitrophica bacterium]|nr:late competence development ComFB family protein [Candidatus Omnitrophota bacterium]
MAELRNYMEFVVEEAVERELNSGNASWCTGEKTKKDVMAIILNRLPARYIVTDKGRIMTKIKETEVQFQADVIREMMRAIELVKKNPRT